MSASIGRVLIGSTPSPPLTRIDGYRTYQWGQDKGHVEGGHLNAIANVVQDVTLSTSIL
jgi:hypothetical protein